MLIFLFLTTIIFFNLSVFLFFWLVGYNPINEKLLADNRKKEADLIKLKELILLLAKRNTELRTQISEANKLQFN